MKVKSVGRQPQINYVSASSSIQNLYEKGYQFLEDLILFSNQFLND